MNLQRGVRIKSYRKYLLHPRKGVEDHVILGPVNTCQGDTVNMPCDIPRCSHRSIWFLCEWKSLYRAGQSGLSSPDEMSGNEDVKSQEHRKQQVKVNEAGCSGAHHRAFDVNLEATKNAGLL